LRGISIFAVVGVFRIFFDASLFHLIYATFLSE
jgi:hypothetical protein